MSYETNLLEAVKNVMQESAGNTKEVVAGMVDAIAVLGDRVRELKSDSVEIQKKMARQSLAGGGTPQEATSITTWRDAKTHRLVPVLGRQHRLAALQAKDEQTPSIGRLMRGIILGGRADDAAELAEERKALSIGADPSGGYTVGGVLANEWIDALRAQMVLTKAGALTVPMDSKSMTIAKLTGDPTVAWHSENAALADADPTFGAVELNAKTVVCLVKLSLELAQDSTNIEQILSTALVNATANAIDAAGLNGVTTNAALAPSGIFNAANRNKVLSIGAPTSWDYVVDGMYELLADDVAMENIGAMIGHPAIWKKMRKLKTGITNDNTPLTMPDEVAALQKLWTTAAPLAGGTTAKAIIGDWRDLLFGVRNDITVRVLDQAFMGSNLQLAVLVYARCDFAAARDQSFCTLEGITV